MKDSGLPAEFAVSALKLAEQSRGVFGLMILWSKAQSDEDRDACITEIQEALDDAAEPKGIKHRPRVSYDSLDRIVEAIRQHKGRLRAIIDAHGGVVAVARKSGIPQPSLSRLLNSGSMPRRTTLHKLAEGLDLEESDIVGEYVR